ncbi:hypothetical protein [Metabacillus bambusae]|uniref:Uncharacterized protein n=1 Tax=Metabacillus bambusae TaxID=2795218 RepID=A0ABS3NA86_9BACI|nr:hypothetical protein [Metabacillus bambusae]MBO1515191.1 hypothetical protein [Metabacillus bambusae]
MNNNQRLLEQLQRMNQLSMDNMINQLRQKMLNRRLRNETRNMLTGLQNQLSTGTEINPSSSSPSNTSSSLDDLMGLLNKLTN